MKKESLRQAIIFLLLSIILMGLGISIVVQANLGTTAFTAIPLVVSELVTFSFGQVTMAFNIFLVIMQIILIGKQFPLIQYFQLIVSIGLGFAIDFWQGVVQGIVLDSYILQLLMTFLGCLVIAVSIILQLEADLTNNPGEGIVRALALRFNSEFAKLKVPFDFALVIIAVVLSWLSLGRIIGVREGTLISAVLVGYYMRVIQNWRVNYQGRKKEL